MIHGGHGGKSLILEEITRPIIIAAIEVHNQLGPGLLEKTYQICFKDEIGRMGLAVESEVVMPELL